MLAQILVSADLGQRLKKITQIIASLGLNLNHPDLLYFDSDSKLGVEQAKLIREYFSLKPYSAKGRGLVLEDAGNLTPEAQNALLKLLEEPPEQALIILGVSSEQVLIPTILSRCQIIYISPAVILGSEASPESRKTQDPGQARMTVFFKEIEDLKSSTIEKRFQYIEKLEEKQEFLKALVIFYQNKLKSVTLNSENVTLSPIKSVLKGDIVTLSENEGYRLRLTKFCKELIQAEEWSAQNVNPRAILEYLMLTMPNFS